MSGRPVMPVPKGEMSPRELVSRIREWAERHGYEFELHPHASEFGKVMIRDPNGGYTTNTIPNAHKGRRLRKHQIRYTVNGFNKHWED